jgi:hypothetical protein
MNMKRVILLALAATIFLGGCVVHEHRRERPREVIVVVPEHHEHH